MTTTHRPRYSIAIAIVFGLTAPAAADSKITELITGYEKEAASCQIHVDGVAKVDAGAKLLLGDGPDDAVAADVARLDAAHVTVQAYCDEVNAALELLRADPKATYKSLERQLDDRDNKIRKLRQTSKKTLDDINPVIQRLVPKINARPQGPGGVAKAQPKSPVDTKPQTKFPSGRAVDLPDLSGTWRLSGTKTSDVATYVDDAKAITTITARAFAAATCEQQRKTIGGSDVASVTLTQAEQGASWKLIYTQGKRTIQTLCLAGDNGGWIWTIDAPAMSPEQRAVRKLGGDDALTKLAWQMLQHVANRGAGGSGSGFGSGR